MEQLSQNQPFLFLIVLLVIVWTLPWKGYALWLAARKKQKWWFIALLLLNTLAVLEIFYIFVFSKKKEMEADK
jgi:Zn-dependent protease with chaperone function